jgi:hypothetical protein
MKLPLIAALVLLPVTALAYPTAVVFAPTGEARPLGNVGLFAYTATNLSPSVSPNSSWFGAQVGLLPQWAYGDSGVSFGGLEAGFDIITPYGTSTGMIVKPVFNLKLGLITEGTYSPSLSTGIMEVSPALPAMDFFFVSASKHLWANKDSTSYGRVTVGYGFNAGDRAQFNGSLPFNGTRSALMLAYETPLAWERWGFMVEYLGGTSEISDLYIGTVLNLSNTTSVAGGAFLANDRSVPYTERNDGMWFELSKSFDISRIASKP